MNFQPRVVDLFSGCGGLSLGFQNAGFNVVSAFENWLPAIRVYKNNFNHPVVQQNLGQVDESVIRIQDCQPDIIIGGPPCQDFSTAGHQDETKGRAELSIKYSEIVSRIRPEYFVMENVATIRKSKSLKQALNNFQEAGYGLTVEVLNAAYYGVPQLRKRMFIIGGLGAQDGFLDELIRDGASEQPMSVYDYLGDSLGIDHYFRLPTNYQRRGVYSIHEPSMTIRAVDRPVPKGYKGHPADSESISLVRGLTPKERSLIQTFPPDFNFSGTKTDINSMIGNAVPVALGEHVAKSLMTHIRKNGIERGKD